MCSSTIQNSLLYVPYPVAYYLMSIVALSKLLVRSFVPLPFINCISGTQLNPLKLWARALCFSTFIPMVPHLENSSVSCLSHCPRISVCCLSFKTQFKSYFLQGSSFDHLSWKEPYLSLNFQRITYGSYHILLCITVMSVVSQRWNSVFWNWICFILCFLYSVLDNVFWMNERIKWQKKIVFLPWYFSRRYLESGDLNVIVRFKMFTVRDLFSKIFHPIITTGTLLNRITAGTSCLW